ncbi:MAG: hypothetical protein IJD85_04450 [Oscillospiraceae bacterium]|nr:hypothetical protein [Oscillospiraceae bacterium]
MKRSVLDCPIEFDKSDFLSLLSLSAGYSIACQNKMGELVIGDNGWNVDIKGGTIRFGERVFKSGVLGSESHESGTWLWGWANTEGGLPEIASAPSRRAKKLLPNVAEFINGKFMLDELHTGHNLAMVCCGISEDLMCYYRCPYNGGAAFVTVSELPDEVFSPLPIQEFVNQYMQIVSSLYCDHRLLAAGFLFQNGNDFQVERDSIAAKFENITLRFDFETIDGMSRVVNISS